jgi:hypothetical protein
VLAFAIGGRRQSLGAGTADNPKLFFSWSADAFFEKRLGSYGAITAEAAYFEYDSGGAVDPLVPNGEGYYVVLGYLLPGTIGPGKLQIVLRHQYLQNNDVIRMREELTLNYFVNGPFLRLGFNGFYDQPTNTYGLKLGVQIIL